MQNVESVTRRSLRPFIALGLVAAVAQTVRVVTANRVGSPSLFVDDAFYYFGIARNIVRGNGSTWDGINTTSGYHPLWMLTILPVFMVVRGRFGVLTAIKVLSGLLWIFALREVAKIAESIGARRAIWFGTLPIAMYAIFFGRSTPFAGVETGLLLPWLLAAIAVCCTQGTRGSRTRLSLLLAAATLTRLDAIATIAAIAAVAVWKWDATASLAKRARSFVWIVAPSIACVTLVAAANVAWTGHLLTVSSRAKARGGGSSRHYALHQYFTQPGSLPIVVGIGALSAVVVLTALFASRWRAHGDRMNAPLRLSYMLTALWLAEFAATALFDSQSSWPQWPWYFYNSFIILLLAPGLIIHAAFPSLESRVVRFGATRWRRAPVIARYALPLAIGVLVGGATSVHANGNENFYTQNAKAALALRATLPNGAVLAMGDRSGVFGYLVERPVVQLEGIVNSNQFLDAVERRDVDQFLRREHVSYFVKSAHTIDRYPLETDGGPEPGVKHCGWRFEPYFGESDKMMFTVCTSDIVYTSTASQGERLTVWKLTKPVGSFHISHS